MEFAQKLNQKELFEGMKAGDHLVENQIEGYKKIKCLCANNNFFGLFSEPSEFNAIAKLQIPIGSTIIRPLELKYNRFYYIMDNLRTDKAIVKDIELQSPNSNEKYNQSKCKCYQSNNPMNKYEINKEIKPKIDLSLDPFDSNLTAETGIRFYLDKNLAQKCIFEK